ncbi:MAG TPA: hypothetical protein VME92_17995 [Acetobacteraceae bacterium]|nr:hypothetical protein [Acetobacteraceae bacterium]
MFRDRTAGIDAAGVASRCALAATVWLGASIGFAADLRAQPFEDDSTQGQFSAPGGAQNVMVHVCKGNALLIGVDVENNRFLCSTVPEPLAPPFVDTSTHLTFGVNFGSGSISIHACPTFAAMVGLSVDRNWLICTQLPPGGWVAGQNQLFGSLTTDGPSGATQAAEPNHPSRLLHVCTNDTIQSLGGIKVDHNIFICVNNVVTSCSQSPSTPGCR